MKNFLLTSAVAMASLGAAGQCPFAVSLKSEGGNCLGTALDVSAGSSATLSIIAWYNGGSEVKTFKAITTGGTGVTIAPTNGRGAAANQLDNAIAVFVDGTGNVYIADRLNNRVQKWPPGGVSGQTVAGGNGQGAQANQLSDPIGIFVDPAGNVYVDDFGNYRIQEWAPGAVSGVTVAGGNGQGSNANQLSQPTSVFVDGGGNCFIADANNNRVQEWAAGASSGVTVGGGNGPGNAANQLDYPAGVFVDGSGNIYIADEKNNRIQKWAPGATSGVTVAGGNGVGSAANQLNTPYSIFVDNSGNIYIDDLVNYRIQEWAPGATSGVTVAGGNGGGSGANQLQDPTGVFVDNQGNVYVADYGNNRIQKWGPESSIVTTFTPLIPGSYTAVVTNSSGCTVTSNAIVIQATSTPAVSISASATNICTGSSVSFTASATNGGSTPVWQWQVNGVNTGTNSAAYTTNGLMNGDLVTCMMTSNAVCASPASVNSDTITISIGPPVAPALTITTTADTICQGAKVAFTALPVNGGSPPVFQWQVNGVNQGPDSPVFITNTLADGDVVCCVMTSQAGCVTAPTATSNFLPVTVKPQGASSVTISTADTAVCGGAQVSFTAHAVDSGIAPAYQWQLNGVNAGTDTRFYTSNGLVTGDRVSCIFSDSTVCAASTSNILTMQVYPAPGVDSGQTFTIALGQGIRLNPVLSDSIVSYDWNPPAGLSDSAIRNPFASPLTSTVYRLTVTAADGCKASGLITVNVSAPVRVPNAFTPNGDGKNDIFYVLSAPVGSRIRDFSIYDRWGQNVFRVRDAPAGDRAFGWNGNIGGQPALQGAYIYSVILVLADGRTQKVQGSLLLIR
jgi:gliding motility-associated-like protein